MRHLLDSDIPQFVRDVLLDPNRTRPIVAVTSHARTDRAWIDPVVLQQQLAGLAEVVFLVTGDATWALSEAMPPLLDVYGGAVRIWWPGLAADADPYQHRLFLIDSTAQADRVIAQVVAAVRQRAQLPAWSSRSPAPEPQPVVMQRTAPPMQAEEVTVTAVGTRVEVESAQRRGILQDADLPMPVLAACLLPGLRLRAQPLRPLGDGTWAFSAAGVLPHAWQRFTAEARTGDVFTCRVQNVNERAHLVFVDVLPGVVGVCHISELDFGRVRDMTELARPGELLAFLVLDVDAAGMTLNLSRKQAYGQPPKPLPSLVEGGRPFVWQPGMPLFENLRRADGRPRILAHRVFDAADGATAERLAALAEELKAAHQERADLVAQIRELRQREQAYKQKARAAEDREAAVQKKYAGEDDPLASERAFLLAVRLYHARRFDEDTRVQQPLQRMRLHPRFLASVRALDGVDVDKIIEVCAQVASNVAQTIAGREVHPLRAGSRGAGSTTRSRDGAKGWRCALQVKTPSARRLHWWNIPGADGATIEFASVGLHDDVDIPE